MPAVPRFEPGSLPHRPESWARPARPRQGGDLAPARRKDTTHGIARGVGTGQTRILATEKASQSTATADLFVVPENGRRTRGGTQGRP